MTRAMLMLVLTLPFVAVSPAPAQAAGVDYVDPADNDPMGKSVIPEIEALGALIAAVRSEVADGLIELTPEAMHGWERGRAGWESMRELSVAHQYGAALKEARSTRTALRLGLRDAMRHKPSPQLRTAFKAWVDAIGVRVKAVKDSHNNFEVDNATRTSYNLFLALHADAVKAAKKKKYDEAFRTLDEAIREGDRVLLQFYPPCR